MATLTITVTNQQAARAQAAFGTWTVVNGISTWTSATAAQMTDAIKAWVKQRTVAYEASLAAQANADTGNAEVW